MKPDPGYLGLYLLIGIVVAFIVHRIIRKDLIKEAQSSSSWPIPPEIMYRLLVGGMVLIAVTLWPVPVLLMLQDITRMSWFRNRHIVARYRLWRQKR